MPDVDESRPFPSESDVEDSDLHERLRISPKLHDEVQGHGSGRARQGGYLACLLTER